jgi:hypothetical protein
VTRYEHPDGQEWQDVWVSLGIRTDVPHPARVYDYILGGKDNISQVVPVTPVSASLVSV